MRRTAMMAVTVVVVVVALTAGSALAATAVDQATPGGDYIKGTAQANTIHGLDGPRPAPL